MQPQDGAYAALEIQRSRTARLILRPSPLKDECTRACAFGLLPFFVCMAVFFIAIGATALVDDPHLSRVHGLSVASRQTVGHGLGVACKTTLVYGGGRGTLLVTTDGPCNPDPEPDISDVDVCSRLGKPDDVHLGCRSLAPAVTLTALGAVTLLAAAAFYAVLAWRMATWTRDMRDLYSAALYVAEDAAATAAASPPPSQSPQPTVPPPTQPLLHPGAPASCEP